jgi:molybdopterin molybdotransferase
MLTVFEATQAVLQHVPVPQKEQVSLLQALHRVLVQDVLVPEESPAFPKALMDGFAVSVTTDMAQSGRLIDDSESLRLRVVETVVAGQVPHRKPNQNEAVRIMTGAPIPSGCCCVVPVEHVEFHEQDPEWVVIPRKQLVFGANILAAGAIAHVGDLLLTAGTQLQPSQVGALAEFGISLVPVSKNPSVAVLATGNELVHFSRQPGAGCIRNSSQPMLAAQIQTANGIPQLLGIAKDSTESLKAGISVGLRADVLLLTGGVSAGIHDLVPQQLEMAGVTRIFHGVLMKPGKPLWFGIRKDRGHVCLVFGLPGNPVSSLACFELFVRPALRRLSGLPGESLCQATLTEPFQVWGHRPVYQPVALSQKCGTMLARPVPWSNSSDLKATVNANGMALLEPEHGPYGAGECVSVWLWN